MKLRRVNVSALARIWELRIFLILGGSCLKRHLVHVRLTLGSRGYFFYFLIPHLRYFARIRAIGSKKII